MPKDKDKEKAFSDAIMALAETMAEKDKLIQKLNCRIAELMSTQRRLLNENEALGKSAGVRRL